MILNFEEGELEQIVRDLAKTEKYQTMFNAKELGFRLFSNDTNLSFLQRLLLSYLGMYSSLTTDIFLGEVSEKVLDNSIFEDAYLFYKSKEYKKKKPSPGSQLSKIGEKEKQTIGQSEFVFRRRPKG